jgi:hypothetical protein
MVRHTFVTTMLDAGVDLRDVQIGAQHADPRTTMRCDRARKTSTRTLTVPRQFGASGRPEAGRWSEQTQPRTVLRADRSTPIRGTRTSRRTA